MIRVLISSLQYIPPLLVMPIKEFIYPHDLQNRMLEVFDPPIPKVFYRCLRKSELLE